MDRAARDEVLKRRRARGFHGGLWTDPPGREWKDYVHGDDELLMVLEGELELELAGETIVPRVGEEIEIRAGVVHTVRNRGATTARWLYAYGRLG
ncbi:cupin domain-containing protein [Sorangium sp. So ce1182]|uniref:cupin domain-containing protein n=1 Tax=Sorangium sp. So ce1182 TaxID=3133334 RepID=UPI003F646CF9